MSDTKVSDIFAKVRERIPLNRTAFTRAFEWYHAKYIKTGRINPVFHAAAIAMFCGYVIEYPHMKHEIEHAREAAKQI